MRYWLVAVVGFWVGVFVALHANDKYNFDDGLPTIVYVFLAATAATLLVLLGIGTYQVIR